MYFLLVLLGFLTMVVVFFVLVFLGRIIEPLLNMLPQTGTDILLIIGFVAFIIAANVFEYRAAYVTGKGKPWHFWATFGTTIAFAILVLSLFLK